MQLSSFTTLVLVVSRLITISGALTSYTSCADNDGFPGTCISPSSCSSYGGTSESGHCPGPSNIQCCTFNVPKLARTVCTNDAGLPGTCISTSSCASQGGSSEAGHCPGAGNIQCCTFRSTCSAPTVNSATTTLIKQFEGFVASPAPDPIGLPTLGYGHRCTTKGCSEVPYSFPLTETTAAELLNSDLKQFESCLAKDVDVPLNANQYGALTSWTFNEGCGNMASSTLVKRLNAGEDPDAVAEQELPKWNKAGGDVLPGLTKRRAAEVRLFETPTSAGALPAC